LFPEVSFKKSKLKTSFSVPTNRRRFFEAYAKGKGFDPLNPANWYKHSQKQIYTDKEALHVLYFHQYDLVKALI